MFVNTMITIENSPHPKWSGMTRPQLGLPRRRQETHSISKVRYTECLHISKLSITYRNFRYTIFFNFRLYIETFDIRYSSTLRIPLTQYRRECQSLHSVSPDAHEDVSDADQTTRLRRSRLDTSMASITTKPVISA